MTLSGALLFAAIIAADFCVYTYKVSSLLTFYLYKRVCITCTQKLFVNTTNKKCLNFQAPIWRFLDTKRRNCSFSSELFGSTTTHAVAHRILLLF